MVKCFFEKFKSITNNFPVFPITTFHELQGNRCGIAPGPFPSLGLLKNDVFCMMHDWGLAGVAWDRGAERTTFLRALKRTSIAKPTDRRLLGNWAQ